MVSWCAVGGRRGAAEGGVEGVVSAQASSVDDGRSAFGRVTVGSGNFAFNIDGVKRKTDDYDIPAPAISARRLSLIHI